MLQKQYPAVINGVEDKDRIRYYSDKGMKICQVETGTIFEEAIDLIDSSYTYTETDELILLEETEDLEDIAIEQ